MAVAAVSIRQMVGRQVLLSVPMVEVLAPATAIQRLAKTGNPNLVAVRQDFSGSFSGCALLIFPEANSLELMRAILGRQIALSEIRGAGGNRQHHSQQLGGHNCQPLEGEAQDVAASSDP